MIFFVTTHMDCHSEERSDEESRFLAAICGSKHRFFAEFILSKVEGLRMTPSYSYSGNTP